MTTINSIMAMLVKNGLTDAEAFEYAEAEDVNAEASRYTWMEDEAYAQDNRYWDDEEDIDERFYVEQLHNFFNEYIAGKTYDELDADAWDIYSDLYKDVYGIRPRWYIQSLYEAKQRAEAEEVRNDLLNDGWIIDDHKDEWVFWQEEFIDEDF